MFCDLLKKFYTTVYSQSLSNECKLLATGNNDGEVVLFDLHCLVDSKGEHSGESLKEPFITFSAHSDCIYAMASTPNFCVTSATGVISGWKWKDLSKKISKASWSINVDCDKSNFGTPEINSLMYDGEKDVVLAACGDWRTRSYDLESGKLVQIFEGHSDYVHDVVVSGNQVATCGEDGQVLIYDQRSGKEPKIKLTPHSVPDLTRPHFGKFISSLDIDVDWLICGGGPKAGVFHLRSTALTTALPPSDADVYVTKFIHQAESRGRGSLVIGGNCPCVYVCSIAGEITAEIATSSPCIYSVLISDSPVLMTFSGSSSKLDICQNFNYKDHSVCTKGNTRNV